MAHELGKHLHEYMGWDGPVTHRQHICWIEWREFISINQPSRDNYYQMQTACEIRRSNSKNPRSIKPEHYKITFSKKRSTSPLPSGSQQGVASAKTPQQQRLETIKQSWIARMTAPIQVRQDGQVIDTLEPPSVKAKRIREEAIKKARAAAQERKAATQQTSGNPDGSNKQRSLRSDGRGRNQVRPNARGSNKKDSNSGGTNS